MMSLVLLAGNMKYPVTSSENFLPEGEPKLVTLLLQHLGKSGISTEENRDLQNKMIQEEKWQPRWQDEADVGD